MSLTIKMPVPDDALFACVNFHASNAAIEETNEYFEIQPPRKVQEETLEFKYWPSKEFPQWLATSINFMKKFKQILSSQVLI